MLVPGFDESGATVNVPELSQPVQLPAESTLAPVIGCPLSPGSLPWT